jgi:hypothetical protein
MNHNRYIVGRCRHQRESKCGILTLKYPIEHGGHLDVVQLIINAGFPVDVRNGTQRTPLALASSKGKVEVGDFLIRRGADLNVRDSQGQAPLHLASQHGHFDMARLLLDHKVDPNITRNDLWSPLHLASAKGHLKHRPHRPSCTWTSLAVTSLMLLFNMLQNVSTLSRCWQSVRSSVILRRSRVMLPPTSSRSFRRLLSPLL